MTAGHVPEPFASAAAIQHHLEQRQQRFCFIGGLVVARRGRMRATQNIDLSWFTGFGGEVEAIDALLDAFSPRRMDARAFALRHRVRLLTLATGVGIDIALAGLPFEERAFSRATYFEYFPGISLLTCSAEDLVVYKAFAGRGTDWDDLEAVTIR